MDDAHKILCPYCRAELEEGAAGCPHCKRSFEGRNPAGALPVGTLLAGRYTVGEMLSLDGEGILYRGVENRGRFRVTIKEYFPITLSAERGSDWQLRPKPGSEVLLKTTRMDFADLYRSIQRITPATGLEAVLDVVEANNTVYAVLENPGGIPLDQWLDKQKKNVPPEAACAMLQPVFNGVAAMHQVGLVHRGICPENIRVLDNGRARLTGYATIGLRTAGSGLHGQLYEGYSAPEQYSAVEFEGRYTDVYSLSAVFYRMVCGQSPVPAAQRLVTDSNLGARTVNPAVPAYVSEALDLGLQLEPARRIQTVPQLGRALSSPQAAEEEARTLHAAGRRLQREKKPALSLTAILTGILILLAVLTLLTLWGLLGRVGQPEEPPASSQASSAPSAVTVNYVPDFVGMTYSQIQTNRQYAGIYLFYVTEEYSDSAPVGTVLTQEPAAGTAITEGENPTIRLVISKGPQMVEMPNTIGFTQEGAIHELESRGLVPSCFMVVNDGSYASGCVVACSVEPGTMVEAGSTIVVYIAADRDVQITTTPETADPAGQGESQDGDPEQTPAE
ncbi:PASTA domain-containing protein [Faecalibacterium sp. An121]|uniref:PASTA domain-containing protein n=1 Tax=Faecalibacterium sp. An121 TaxID=1965550 RepID=UPI000B3AC718|nr:PASTA domain-containing protein [Faecalibacterium sp. An121]OUQ40757.1 histidine kinase [Faecalibacterium sp. An121]